MSPQKKKPKLLIKVTDKSGKRKNDSEEGSSKKLRSDSTKAEDLQSLKKKNFIKACEYVSYKAYFNYSIRLKMIYLPACVNNNKCKHLDLKDGLKIKQMPTYAEESFKIEMKTNMWCEALEVCFLCITPTQYLSANVLQDVVEIILNAHEDPDIDYTIQDIIEKSQQILSKNFSTHPPCLLKAIRKNYKNFLTSPMNLKENTFTNRAQFGCDKGIVKYCLNRLEYEINPESKDGPLINKCENIPEEMKQSVKGLHWQKEKFEIFEVLERPERIKRLMAVLESIIELLKLDLAIWHSRHTKNLECHIMKSHRPLMTFVLWSDNVLYTGAVNGNCRQILRLFSFFIHLKYPEDYIRTLVFWVNAMTQTFYICENNSNSDYPNIGKYCTSFANEFYKIIAVLPQESITRILQWIQPTYMQYLLGILHLKSILSTNEDNIIQIMIDFVKHTQWKRFTIDSPVDSINSSNWKQRKVKNISNYLYKVIKYAQKENISHSPILECQSSYPKLEPKLPQKKSGINQSDVLTILYITIDAYLDAYSIPHVQNTIDTLNNQLLQRHNSMEEESKECLPEYCSYVVTEHLIKTYRSIYQLLKELMSILQKMQTEDQLPEMMKIFEKNGLLTYT